MFTWILQIKLDVRGITSSWWRHKIVIARSLLSNAKVFLAAGMNFLIASYADEKVDKFAGTRYKLHKDTLLRFIRFP